MATYCVFLTGSDGLADYDGVRMANAKQRSLGPCKICGNPADKTLEHIVPKSVLKKLDLTPAKTAAHPLTTSLCNRCNNAGSQLHNNEDLVDLIAKGVPISQKTLEDLAEWVTWVLLLLCVETETVEIIETGPAHLIGQRMVTSASPWPIGDAIERLKERFTGGSTDLPLGVRVYAAVFDKDVVGEIETNYAVVLENDPRHVIDEHGIPGFVPSGGKIAAAVLVVGTLVLMVLGPTRSSGRAHDARLDAAAKSIGLASIWPRTQGPHDSLPTHTVKYTEIRNLFVAFPFEANNVELLPPDVQSPLMPAPGEKE